MLDFGDSFSGRPGGRPSVATSAVATDFGSTFWDAGKPVSSAFCVRPETYPFWDAHQAGFNPLRGFVFFLVAALEREPFGRGFSMALRKMRLMRVW